MTTLRPVGLAVTGPGAHGLPQDGQKRAPGGSGLRHEAQGMGSSVGRGAEGARETVGRPGGVLSI
ncbi:hypothetical protein, partial [Streptomyces sp. NPDC058745]